MVSNQASLFLIFAVEGVIIGLIFDMFRILRKSFKTSDILTYFEDILFWIITGILILYSIFVLNNGEIRFFMFIGIFLGTMLYMLLISQYVIKISVKIILIIKNIIKFILKVIIFPFKMLLKTVKMIFKKPILFCIINTKKLLRKSKDSIKQINIKNYKKIKNKGGKEEQK